MCKWSDIQTRHLLQTSFLVITFWFYQPAVRTRVLVGIKANTKGLQIDVACPEGSSCSGGPLCDVLTATQAARQGQHSFFLNRSIFWFSLSRFVIEIDKCEMTGRTSWFSSGNRQNSSSVKFNTHSPNSSSAAAFCFFLLRLNTLKSKAPTMRVLSGNLCL